MLLLTFIFRPETWTDPRELNIFGEKLNLTELKNLYRKKDHPRVVESERNTEEKVERWLNCFSKENKTLPENKYIKTAISVHLP